MHARSAPGAPSDSTNITPMAFASHILSLAIDRHRHRLNPVLSRTKVSNIHLRVRPCCRTLSHPPLQWMLIAVLFHIAGPALPAELRIRDARAGRPAGLAFAATQRAEARDPYPRPSLDARFARVNSTGGCSSALHGPAATPLSSSAATQPAWCFATGTPECCSPSAAVYEDRRAAGGQDEPGCCCTCAPCGPEAASYLGCWSSPRPTLRCQACEEGASSELPGYNATHGAGLPFVGGVPPTPDPWETCERTGEEGSSGAEHAV